MSLLKATINISTEKEFPLYMKSKMENDIEAALRRFCFLNECKITDINLEVIM